MTTTTSVGTRLTMRLGADEKRAARQAHAEQAHTELGPAAVRCASRTVFGRVAARSLLRQEQFERLNRISDELVKTRARFPAGDWKSYHFQDALGKPSREDKASDEEWERQIAVLQRWHAAHPDSMGAVLALSDAMIGYGWKTKGT